MSSIVIAGDTSGSVTLQAPAVAGATTVNLPSTLGNTSTSAFATTDASGNLGLSVTPSAWFSGVKVIQFGTAGVLFSNSDRANLASNLYIDSGTNSRYINNGFALRYAQEVGEHVWSSAPSGTAGNVATLTRVLAVEKDKSLALQGAVQQTGTGITFPATQSASSDANTLDDYEEGTWTPSYNGGLTGITYGSVRNGYYRKIGNQVTVWFGIMSDGLTVTSSALNISGLPFTAISSAGSNGTLNINNSSRWASNPPTTGTVEPNTTAITLYNSLGATGAGTDPVAVTTGEMATGSGNRNMVFGTATYIATS